MLTTVLLGVLVFCSTAAIDAIQAYWLRAFNARRANLAAFLSVSEYSISCLCFFAFLEHSWWLIFPEAAGLWVGSQWSIRRIARSDDEKKAST